MHFKIWPTFKKRNGSIINSRLILNKIPYFQTTLVCWYLYILDQTSRPKLKFNHLDTKCMLKSQIKNLKLRSDTGG